MSRDPIRLPKIQFKLSETWIDDFEYQSLNAPSPTERELARRVTQQLKDARAAGEVISAPMDIDVLMPFQFLTGNEDLPENLPVIVLVNEMCASMCDIFAAVLQDNGLATIAGSRTTGAGGNVVMHIVLKNS